MSFEAVLLCQFVEVHCHDKTKRRNITWW